MAPLRSLRRNLNRLRWYRWGVAVSAAFFSLLIAVLWGLLFLVAADILFQLPVSQRVAAMALIAIVALTLVWRRVRAGWRMPEDTEEIALLVERNHNLDSDLIAAMQFHTNMHDSVMGSPTLRQAVIQRASDLADSLDFFQGISAKPLPGRAALLSLTLIAAVALGVLFPSHAQVFWRRLQLGKDHYPTRTTIAAIGVNGEMVLDDTDPTLTPNGRKCAEGKTVELLVGGSGVLPDKGRVRLRSGGQDVELELSPLTSRQRWRRLQRAREILNEPAPSLVQVTTLALADCPQASQALSGRGLDRLETAKLAMDETIAKGEQGLAADVRWYAVDLPRHGSTIRYDLELGDAWTEEGRIEMIPLPTVALRAVAMTPAYSKLGRVAMSPGARQLRVLEGSEVSLSIQCLNNKELESAWATLMLDGEEPLSVELQPDGTVWTLPTAGTPLEKVQQRIQFTVQVKDADGLQLPSPISGQIQVRPDRPPTGAATVLHRVVLPEARPTIAVRANDDFGIGELQLRILVEHPQDAIETTAPGVSQPASEPLTNGDNPPDTDATESVIKIPHTNAALPLEIEHPLALAPLQLAKGDRVKITLEVIDERGPAPGKTFQASPLILEVSDEAGVLAAVSESDEQSERKLNELIQQQLGIGDSP